MEDEPEKKVAEPLQDGPRARKVKREEPKSPPRPPAPSKSGYNWSAVAILVLFMLGPLAIGAIKVWDMLYPKEAAMGQFRNQLVRCYTSANPKNLKKIDEFVLKYGQSEGKRRRFWAQMIEKYPKSPECHN